jgi:hypothetical protein
MECQGQHSSPEGAYTELIWQQLHTSLHAIQSCAFSVLRVMALSTARLISLAALWQPEHQTLTEFWLIWLRI